MKKATNIPVTRYFHRDFFIDIVDKTKTDGIREAWLTHKDYGISVMMFGLPSDQNGRRMLNNEFIAIVKANLPVHITNYKAAYMKGEEES